MLHPVFVAEGMAWELSPPELREGSKAWLLALCHVGGLCPTLCPPRLALCTEGAVGQAPQPGLCQAVPGLCWTAAPGQSCAKGTRHLCGSCLLDVTLIGLGQAEQRQPGTAE